MEERYPANPVENPDRISLSASILQEFEFIAPIPASLEDIARVHGAEHIQRVKSNGLYDAAALAAGSAIAAARLALAGEPVPSYQTSCGVVDMISHLLERYLTTTKDVILTDRLIEGTMKSIIEAMKVVKEEPTNYEARATICWSGTIAHNGSLSVGRTEDWASHRLEHELSALYDVAHGAGLAVIFPAYMRYTIDVDLERYKRLAVEVMHINPEGKTSKDIALEGIQAFEDFYKSIGMPVTFAEIGAKESDIDYLIGKLNKNVGDIVGTFKGLTMEDAKKVYKLACK